MRQVKKDSTNVSVDVYIIDDTDGTPELGVLWNTAGMDLEYRREGAVVVNITEATLAALTTAHTDGGFLEIGHGLYRLDLPDAAVATGAETVSIQGTVTGMIVLPQTIQLVDFDPEDSVRLGLTALPNAAADAAGGLPISDGGGLDMDAILVDTADMQPIIEKGAYVGPKGLGVWIDDGAGNTNTVLGVDGTPDNPVSTIAAATTIATALGSQRFYLVNDTVITLAQTYEGYEFIGVGIMNQIDLGSQDVDNSHFENVILTGTQGGTQFMQALRCQLQALLAVEIIAHDCEITGDITLRVATNQTFIGCSSATPGGGTPDLNFPGAGGATTVNWRHYSGGLTVKNARLNDVMSYEAIGGQLIIDATCTSLEVHIRGMVNPITDNGTTSIITQTGAYDEVEIAKAVWDRILTGATHNIATSAGRRLRGIQEFQGYEGGAVWIDTVSGTPGTTDFENGTVENPVDSIADANTLAASLGLHRFAIAPGSTITFAASQDDEVFEGHEWTLALGGQSISGSYISGARVSGIATGASPPTFVECTINAVTLPPCELRRCGLADDITAGSAGDFHFNACFSEVAGTGTPGFDFGAALNASNFHMRHYSGGIEIQNMGAGAGSYTMSLEGHGQLIINANCSATSTIAIRGHFTVTDNAGGAVTLSDDARYDVDQINDQADLALSDYDGPTKAEMDAAHALLATPADVATELGTYDSPTKAEMDAAHALLATPADVATELGTYDGPTKAEMDAAHALLATPAQVNTQVSDVMKTDTVTLPGQAAPPLAPTMEEILAWVFKVLRNKKEQTAAEWRLFNDAGAVVDSKAAVSDAAGLTTKEEIVSGP